MTKKPSKAASEAGRALVKIRHRKLSPERRSEIAKHAAAARWHPEKPADEEIPPEILTDSSR